MNWLSCFSSVTLRSTFFSCLLCSALIGLVMAWSPTRAAPPAAEPFSSDVEPITGDEFLLPVDETTEPTIDQMIQLLGSPRYPEREQATKSLLEIGAPALGKLRNAYLSTDDFETRSRIESIVQTAYMDFHVFSNFGFLGISRDPHTPGPDEDPRILPGHCGIKIQQVLKNTGAEQAGMEVEDVVIALDGELIPGIGPRAFEAFSAGIRERRPGTRVTLTVLRGTVELKIEAVLTRPTPDRTLGGGVQMLREKTERAKARFAVWWVKFFRVASGGGGGQP